MIEKKNDLSATIPQVIWVKRFEHTIHESDIQDEIFINFGLG